MPPPGTVWTSLQTRLYRRNHSDPTTEGPSAGRQKYRALASDCRTYPSKLRCCPKAAAGDITREEPEDVRGVARECVASEVCRKIAGPGRRQVERLLGHLARILGLGRLRLRGPCGAGDEFTLAATARNLRTPAKLRPRTTRAAATR